ncbi:uncharacterized protein [Rutidosis leptorrhynchoides]|uniref:uncharacterized protein n=1 Tax=Rutidosis leptorrhynchoides TaxID=125765 RepID=UPI003A99A8AB
MNTSVLKNSNKAFKAILMMKHPITLPIQRVNIHHHHQQQQQLHLPKAFYSRLHISKRTFCTNSNNNRNKSGSITNSGFVGWYLGMIKAKPIITKSITSALIYTAADFTSQTMTRSSSEAYDLIRTCRMAGYGMIIAGPSLHFWFNFVSRLLPKQDIIATFKKMFMGQALFGPFMTAAFFSVNAALQGEKGHEIVARLKRDMLPTMINNVIYWPLCDFITFRFVPVHLQPLVSNSFSYVWTIYITYMANLAKAGTN